MIDRSGYSEQTKTLLQGFIDNGLQPLEDGSYPIFVAEGVQPPEATEPVGPAQEAYATKMGDFDSYFRLWFL